MLTLQDQIEQTTPSLPVQRALTNVHAGIGVFAVHGVTIDDLRRELVPRIEDDQFEMARGDRCVVGWALGDYADKVGLLADVKPHLNGDGDEYGEPWRDRLPTGEKVNEWAARHGFYVGTNDDDEPLVDYEYRDLGEAWERVLRPEWFAVPQTKTVRVCLDLIVNKDEREAEVAADVRRTVGEHYCDRDLDVWLYTWSIVPDDEPF